MKIALVGPYYPNTGGVQIYMTYLAKELMKMGHEITVISYANASPQLGEKVKRAPKMTIPGLRGFVFILHSAYSLAREQFDVASTHYALTSGLAGFLASFTGKKYVITFHGSDLRLSKMVSRLAASRADAIVSVSSWVKEELNSLGIDVNRVISGGIDPSIFMNLPSKEKARDMLNLNNYVVLSVGTFTQAKGFDMIPIIASLVNKEVDAEFILVGDGPLLNELRRKTSLLGLNNKVKFVGSKTLYETSLYYRAADVLLHPARYEGYGLVALESLAAGTPVVATNTGGLKDVVRDGVDGFLVKRDPNEFASRILVLLKNEDMRDKMGKEGRKRALKRTWRRVAEEYVELFSEVI